VGHRHGSDLALLWLWCRPAAAAGAALKSQKTTGKKTASPPGDSDAPRGLRTTGFDGQGGSDA